MTGAWVAVGLLLLGLPLLAWWVGGRRFWARLERLAGSDLYREMVLRHRLRPAEIAQVEGAVTWGRELQDPRLRAAVVDWARTLRAEQEERGRRHPRRRRVVWAICVVWLTVAVASLISRIVQEGWTEVFDLWWMALWLAVIVWTSRAPGRALRLNSRPAPASGADAGAGAGQRE